ncbi:hypothetical protein C8R48DRAFT_682663 [Suillus tomentosus]|nr:hypothetical protein C8R48DRAFT_682663 [Suillus tomentosus]
MARFCFADLPIELVHIIIIYAAQPTFDQDERYDRSSPYSSALNLCLVSKFFRRAALPKLLHTILLPKSRNVTAFMQALLIQEAYKKANNVFQCDYVSHVRKMWIGPPDDNFTSASERSHAIGLLTPVMFAAPSLALSWKSVDLLIECLEHAWKSRPATPVNEEHSQPPWKTQTLSLTVGNPIHGTKWNSLTDTPQGSAFLASICHLSSITYVYRDYTDPQPLISSQNYRLPDWMKTAPLASFKSLQTVTLPYPRTKAPVSVSGLSNRGVDMHMELLAFPATLLRAQNGIPNEIQAFTGTGTISCPGEEAIRSDGTHLRLSLSKLRWYSGLGHGWEKIWACML